MPPHHADTTATPTAAARKSERLPWRQALTVYLEPASLRMLSLGFAAGLPLLLVLGTLSFWLREAGVDRSTIGHLSWIGLAYGFKWVWAPLVDRLPLPFLTRAVGRRRSWLLLAQAGVMAGLAGLALSDPRAGLQSAVSFALLVAFASATQDIALDAFRIESADPRRQAALAATYQTGYRLAMIWAGAGALWLAAMAQHTPQNNYDPLAWRSAYFWMALSMLPGMLTVLLSREPLPVAQPPVRNAREWLRSALLDPFLDFFGRYRWQAVLILVLISVYRISDVVMGIMANPFYVDMGYSKEEIAAISKAFGVVMTLVGAFIGGVMSMRLGVLRVLMLGAVLSAASNLLFAWLSTRGHDVRALTLVISVDNLAAGIASSAFIAYLSSLTSSGYTATQYALLSSMMLMLPKFVAGWSGDYVDAFGYQHFFYATALLGAPVLLLVSLAARAMPLGAAPARPDEALEAPR